MFVCLQKEINFVIYEDENNFWAKDPKLVESCHTGVTFYCSITVGKKYYPKRLIRPSRL